MTLLTTVGCASLEPLRPIEPRTRDSLPTQVAKTVVYVPAALLVGTVVVGSDILCEVARDRAAEVALDEELGRPESALRRQIY